MTAVKTRTKTNTRTLLLVAVGLLAVGAAAFAMVSRARQAGDQNFYVQCHDGAWRESNSFVSRDMPNPSLPEGIYYYPSEGCQTAAHWKRTAARYCQGRGGEIKTGINTFKIRRKCTLSNPGRGYGYGYGYRRR